MVNPRLTEIAVSKNEIKYRKSSFSDVSKVVNRNPLCTSCNQSVKLSIINGKPCLHPQLETLLCEKCFTFYGDGDFSVDEDGSDKYCRWCGQGGTIFQCSKCVAGFCKKCIKRNLTRAILDEVDRDDWLCFVCNVEPLWELRSMAWAAVTHSKNIKPPPSATAKVKQNSTSDKPKISPHLKKHYKMIAQNLHTVVGDVQSVAKELKKECDRINDEKCRPKHIIEQHNEGKATEALSALLKSSQQQLLDVQSKLDNFCQEWKVSKELVDSKLSKENQTVTSDSVSSDEPTQNQKDEESSTHSAEESKVGDEKVTEESKEEDDSESTKVESDELETTKKDVKETNQNNKDEESKESGDIPNSPVSEPSSENKRKRSSGNEVSDNGETDNQATPKKLKLLPTKHSLKEEKNEENGTSDENEDCKDSSPVVTGEKENGENGTMEVAEEVV